MFSQVKNVISLKNLTKLKSTRNILLKISHSKYSQNSNQMSVIPIEALDDNYMYLIVDETSKECAAVDPVNPKKILDKVKELQLNLTKILTTHHHWDHASGNPELVKSLNAKIPVYGGDDRISGITNKIGHNDLLTIGSLKIRCLFTPCHTSGHICYFVSKDQVNMQPAVFSGDTLFVSGCGRFFEGNAENMYNNLINILGKLPSNTLVFCGHEYSIQNLKFSLHVEPNNETTKAKLSWAEQMRSSHLRTIPSTINDEFEFNPFMRVQMDHFKNRYKQTDPILVMQELRKEKDSWKG